MSQVFKQRRPLDDDKPDGYQESDRDYFENNGALVLALLNMIEDELHSQNRPYLMFGSTHITGKSILVTRDKGES